MAFALRVLRLGRTEKRVISLRNFSLPAIGKIGLVSKTGALAVFLTALAPGQTQTAVANGDTRTISLYHTHTGESITATFRVNGSYDSAVLDKLNNFLRDWRNNDTIKMDPRLFDTVWETYRESGSREPIHIVSAYRSPATNAMLRRRSSAVAEFSQHMLGKAMDMHYTDVPMSKVREIAMRLQRGGVGYYPTAGSPFVHLDVGSVRAWPRMSYDQLARLFPDGKTVHLPANGQPLARYEEARAQVEGRNGVSVPSISQVQSKGFFASLFGGGDDEPAAAAPARGAGRLKVAVLSRNARSAPQPAAAPAQSAFGQGASSSEDSGAAAYFVAEAARRAGATTLADASPVLRGRVRPAPAAPVPAPAAPVPAPEPAPIAAAKPATQVAVLDPRRPAQDEIKGTLGAVQTQAPLPPRRPADLATAAVATASLSSVNVPLPPVRPGEFARPPVEEAPLRTARAADLPSVITAGGRTPITAAAASTVGMLAFAPSAPSLADPPKPLARAPAIRSAASSAIIAQPIGLRAALGPPRKVSIAASRLDRSNFRILTAPQEIARLTPVALGPLAAPLRAAARVNLNDLVFAAPADIETRFQPFAAGPSPAAFSGPAVRPLPRLASASAEAATRLN